MSAPRLDLVQTLSLEGSAARPNEDRCGADGTRAWVIDGATDLGPPGLLGPRGGAVWLAETANRAFAAADAPSLAEACAAVFGEIEANYARDRRRAEIAAWETPKAAFAAVQLVGDALQIAWAADCPVLHWRGDAPPRWLTPRPDGAEERAAARAVGPMEAADADRRAAALADRRAHRAQPGAVALSPDAAASRAATSFSTARVACGDELLLMSDGFSCLVSDYAAFTPAGLVAALRARGLACLGTRLREIERADAACTRFPRFKTSDDATALWLRVRA